MFRLANNETLGKSDQAKNLNNMFKDMNKQYIYCTFTVGFESNAHKSLLINFANTQIRK